MRAVIIAVAVLASGCALSSGGAAPAADATSVTGSVGDVTVQGAFLTSPGAGHYTTGGTAVANFTLENDGSSWDTLTSASTPVASSVRLFLFDREQEQISVPTGPAGQAASAQLVDLNQQVIPGGRVPLTFQFTDAGSLTLDLPVH